MKIFYMIGFAWGAVKYSFTCGKFDGEKAMYRDGANMANAYSLHPWTQ